MWHRRGLALALLVLAAGCNGPSASEKPIQVAADTKTATDAKGGERKSPPPDYGDTRIEASIGNVSGLIPNLTSDSASHEVGNFMYNGLVTLGRNLEIVPELAKSWEFSKDCLTLDFTLNEGVRWHDGKPFSAADVVFTFETTMDSKTRPTCSGTTRAAFARPSGWTSRRRTTSAATAFSSSERRAVC